MSTRPSSSRCSSLLYLFAVGRFGAPRWRIACYAGAMALLAVAFWTPLHHLGLHYLLTAHLLQNVILAEWAPLLAVLGVSRPMARALARARASGGSLTQPAVALPLWLVDYFAWHVPPVYDAALRHQAWLIHVEHACYFATGHPRLVAARAGHRRGGSPRARAPRMRSRRSCSPRRSGCCSRCSRSRSTVLRPRAAARLGALPARRPGDRRRDDGERAGGRALRRLPLLVPALPRRGRRYLEAVGDDGEVGVAADARARA